MTRGLPAVWSGLLGLPFVAVGGYLVWLRERYPLTADQPAVTSEAGVVLAVFGVFVVGFGVYVQFAAMPERPTMRDDEWIVDDRDPAQRSALAKAFVAVPFLAAGLHLLYFTARPLVYPTVALALGLYLLSTGLYEYWQNTLTTYLVTNRRVLEEYRFLSLVRTEIPLEKVRAVEERQSAWDALFGLGNVHVRAGSAGGMTVGIRSVYDSAAFADTVRDQLGRVGGNSVIGIDDGEPIDVDGGDHKAADQSRLDDRRQRDTGGTVAAIGGRERPSEPPTERAEARGRDDGASATSDLPTDD
jgi:membrane protein YdbS with pleckstrin-like domain